MSYWTGTLLYVTRGTDRR